MRRVLLITLLLIGFVGPALANYQQAQRAYERGDYDSAFEKFQALAEQGDARAQNQLGQMYSHGLNVERDYAEAIKWYRKAAKRSFAEAQFNLGWAYEVGRGVPQSYEEAIVWYRQAAEKGLPSAQISLGLMYENGKGVPQDYVLALMWYDLAALYSPLPDDRDLAAEDSEMLAAKMTASQIAEAKRLARTWKPKTDKP